MDALRPLLTAATLPPLKRLRKQLETDVRQLRLRGFARGKRLWLDCVEIAAKAPTGGVAMPDGLLFGADGRRRRD
jgi:hypothetical protein